MKQKTGKSFRWIRELVHYLAVVLGAVGLTLAFFLVLPLMQTLSKPPKTDLMYRSMDTAKLDAPDPPPEIEPEKKPEPEEPPKLDAEQTPPLDLSQLELALNPSFSDNWLAGDFVVKLGNIVSKNKKNVEALFAINDLDQKPRPVYQFQPIINDKMRRKGGGTVYIIFIVDERGRVLEPKVVSSPDPIYEQSALNAVKKWRFEPGKRNGKPVRFRMRVPITFPKGG